MDLANNSLYSIRLTADGEAAPIETKSAPVGGAVGLSYGRGFVDVFNRQPAPSPVTLVREALNTAYACINLNANAVASTPLRLYVKRSRRKPVSRIMDRGDAKSIGSAELKRLRRSPTIYKAIADATDVKEVTSHPLLDLLNNPVDVEENGTGMSQWTLLDMIQRFMETIGRGYLWMEPGGFGGLPRCLWVLPGQYVQEMPDLSNQRVISEYFYMTGGAQKSSYSPSEIIPFRFGDMATAGYIGGFSPLRACFEQVQVLRLHDGLVQAQLSNGGKPSAVWSPSGENAMIGQAEAKRMRSAFQQAFAQAKAGGVMVAESPGNLELLSWPSSEVMSPEHRAAIRTEVAACFGVPISKLDRNDANRASAQTGDYAHAKDAIVPRLRQIEATLNTFLVPVVDDGGQLFFAFDDPDGLHDDAAEQTKWGKGLDNGAVLRNEYRQEQLGLDPAPWGDAPLVLNTMLPVDEDGNPVRPLPPPAPKEEPKPEPPPPDDTAAKMVEALAPVMAQMASVLKAVADSADRTTRAVVRELAKEKGNAGVLDNGGGHSGAGGGVVHAGSSAGCAEASQLLSGEGATRSAPGTIAEARNAGAVGADGVDASDRRSGSPTNAGSVPAGVLATGKASSDGVAREGELPQTSADLADAGGPVDAGDNSVRGGVVLSDECHAQPAGKSAGDAAAVGIVITNLNDGEVTIIDPQEKKHDGSDSDGGRSDNRAGVDMGEQRGSEPLAVAHSASDPLDPAPLATVLRQIFSDQCTAVLAELPEGEATKAFWDRIGKFGLPDRFKGLSDWVQKMADATSQIIETYIVAGGQKLLAKIGVSIGFDPISNPDIIEAAKNAALKFSESTNATTSMQLDQALDKLREELAEGLEVGDTRVELRKRVREVFDTAEKERADTIARTESSRARHEGELKAAKRSEVVKTKSWLASSDACDRCLEYAAMGEIPLDQNFDEDDYGPISGPPGHPRCACSCAFQLHEGEQVVATEPGEEGAAS